MRKILFLLLLSVIARGAHAQQPIMDDTVGSITLYTVQPEDTLYKIARAHDVGFVEIRAANPSVDVWQPTPGSTITLPTMHVLPAVHRQGIVINLAELRLFYFIDAETVMTFPIGIGRAGWETPTGSTQIVKKRENPTWIPPQSIRDKHPDLPASFPPGPNNPLGNYALNLGWPGYVMHGTNKPYGIGTRCSHGCIRLYPEDIATLFQVVALGTPVQVIDTPFKVGWRGQQLYLEVAPNQQQTDAIANGSAPIPTYTPGVYDAIVNKAKGHNVYWQAIENTIAQHTTIPTVIGRKSNHER